MWLLAIWSLGHVARCEDKRGDFRGETKESGCGQPGSEGIQARRAAEFDTAQHHAGRGRQVSGNRGMTITASGGQLHGARRKRTSLGEGRVARETLAARMLSLVRASYGIMCCQVAEASSLMDVLSARNELMS